MEKRVIPEVGMERLSENVVIQNGSVCSSGRVVEQRLLIQGQKFVKQLSFTKSSIDADGLFVTPGLIDIQMNGYGGHEFLEGEYAIRLAQQVLPQHGITGFLPTIGSCSAEFYRSFDWRAPFEESFEQDGAEVLGWHLEGPFLQPKRAGVHSADHFCADLDATLWNRIFETQSIRVMTLAPELPLAPSLLQLLVSHGVVVAIGHSEAGIADLQRAKELGARYVTHLYNGMGPFHHRAPGIIGAVLGDRLFGATLISDRHHVCDEAIRMAWRCLGEELCLVSDSSPLMGTASHEGVLLGTSIEAEGERSISVSEHVLAGSMVPLDEQVRRFSQVTGCSFASAIRAATEVPASYIGRGESKGGLSEGYDADCAFWDQKTLQVVATICRGKLIYSTKEFERRVV